MKQRFVVDVKITDTYTIHGKVFTCDKKELAEKIKKIYGESATYKIPK